MVKSKNEFPSRQNRNILPRRCKQVDHYVQNGKKAIYCNMALDENGKCSEHGKQR